MNSICICGAGTMGSGIAQVCATSGFQTILFDLNESVIGNAAARIKNDLQTLVNKQKISAARKEEIEQQIHFTSQINDCRANLVIEAIVENAEVKLGLFNQLAELNPDTTIFATNTSSLSVSALAKKLKHPQRMAGLHFFNPAPVMKLVEVVKGEQTSDDVVTALVTLTRNLGKTPVVCKDSPGFIVNRVARPYYIESLRIAEEGQVGMEVIDRLLETRGFRMGPFRLMDLIGNDVNYAVSCSVYEQLQQPERLKPSFLQKENVDKGFLGKKSGRGYYDYSQT